MGYDSVYLAIVSSIAIGITTIAYRLWNTRKKKPNTRSSEAQTIDRYLTASVATQTDTNFELTDPEYRAQACFDCGAFVAPLQHQP